MSVFQCLRKPEMHPWSRIKTGASLDLMDERQCIVMPCCTILLEMGISAVSNAAKSVDAADMGKRRGELAEMENRGRGTR